MLLADSSAWIEYLRATGSPVNVRVREAIRAAEIVVTDPVILEVMAGARRGLEDKVLRLLSEQDYEPVAAARRLGRCGSDVPRVSASGRHRPLVRRLPDRRRRDPARHPGPTYRSRLRCDRHLHRAATGDVTVAGRIAAVTASGTRRGSAPSPDAARSRGAVDRRCRRADATCRPRPRSCARSAVGSRRLPGWRTACVRRRASPPCSPSTACACGARSRRRPAARSARSRRGGAATTWRDRGARRLGSR